MSQLHRRQDGLRQCNRCLLLAQHFTITPIGASQSVSEPLCSSAGFKHWVFERWSLRLRYNVFQCSHINSQHNSTSNVLFLFGTHHKDGWCIGCRATKNRSDCGVLALHSHGIRYHFTWSSMCVQVWLYPDTAASSSLPLKHLLFRLSLQDLWHTYKFTQKVEICRKPWQELNVWILKTQHW